ncbi:MAG: hypothetical protein KDD37_11740, partial [Bdellovibrionales bacterium]|nr:hypothetical protein [Bdellovibrionales bacterium]
LIIFVLSLAISVICCLPFEQNTQATVYIKEKSISETDIARFESNLVQSLSKVDAVASTELKLKHLFNQLANSTFTTEFFELNILGVNITLKPNKKLEGNRAKRELLRKSLVPAISKALFLTNLQDLRDSLELKKIGIGLKTNKLIAQSEKLNSMYSDYQNKLAITKEPFLQVPSSQAAQPQNHSAPSDSRDKADLRTFRPEDSDVRDSDLFKYEFNLLPVSQQYSAIKSLIVKNNVLIKLSKSELDKVKSALSSIASIDSELRESTNANLDAFSDKITDLLGYAEDLKYRNYDSYKSLVLTSQNSKINYIYTEFVQKNILFELVKYFILCFILLFALGLLLLSVKTKYKEWLTHEHT